MNNEIPLLSKQLKERIEASKSMVPKADLSTLRTKIISDFSKEKNITRDASKKAIDKAITGIEKEFGNLKGLDLADLQQLKQLVGDQGSWANKYGTTVTKDDTETIEAYNTIYDVLKKEIENRAARSGDEGIKMLKQKL